MASTSRLSLPVDRKVEDLLLWRDPRKSGIVLGLTSALYFLLEWSHYNVVTLLANTGLIAVSAAFLWSVIANLTHKPGPPVPVLLKEGVTESQVRGFASDVTPLINKALAFAYRLASGKEVVLSLQVVVALFVVSKLGGWFTLLGWGYFLVLLAFTVPKVYELKKPEIDAQVSNMHAQTKKIYDQHLDKYVQKIPRASTATPSTSSKTQSKIDELKGALSDVGIEPKKVQ